MRSSHHHRQSRRPFPLAFFNTLSSALAISLSLSLSLRALAAFGQSRNSWTLLSRFFFFFRGGSFSRFFFNSAPSAQRPFIRLRHHPPSLALEFIFHVIRGKSNDRRNR
jgi:hypothetical protein